MLAKSNYKKIVQKNFLSHRKKTRRQRYKEKMKTAQFLPISIGCVNFMHDGNLAFLIRSAVCFGVKDVHVVGSVDVVCAEREAGDVDLDAQVPPG